MVAGPHTDYGPPVEHDLHVRVLQVMQTKLAPTTWAYDAVCSSFWRLYLNASAGAAVRVAGRRIRLTAGRCWLIPAWVTFDCLCTRSVDHLCIHFDLPGLSTHAVQRWCGRPIRTIPADAYAPLVASLQEAPGSVAGVTLETVMAAKALVFASVGDLLRRTPSTDWPRCLAPFDPRHDLTPALTLIEHRIAEPLSNAELAAACHCSESQLVRRFRQVVDQTPAAYVSQRRIALASSALTQTNLTIEEVADRFGFANRYHFSRVFRRHMGMPPGQYRRQPLV